MSHVYDRQYIDGAWCASEGSEYIEVQAPNTGEPQARVSAGHTDDVARAVQAARRAAEAWGVRPLAERVQALQAWQAALAQRKDALALAIAREVGTPLKISHIVQVDAPLRNISNFIDCAQAFRWSSTLGHSEVVREPFGVVGCITPWNFPLHQIVLKVVPALLAGNTIVLKPSELTPQTTQLVCEALHEAALPDGVFNVVNGLGTVVGAALAASEAVDMLSFTGSTAAGRAVSALAADTVKKVATELGGKSPAVVLPGADLPRAVKATLASCMLNNGQTCSALTRLLVPQAQCDEVQVLLEQELAKLTVGASVDAASRIGPLISRRQQEAVKALVGEAVAQGAQAIGAPAPVPAAGHFVAPQAYWVAPDNPLFRQEVFGPVLSVSTYVDEAEAIRLANDTVYGLAAAVWGEPVAARAVAGRIRAGQVDINGARFNPLAPFGGYKQSGVGREAGPFGLEEFMQTKAIQTNPAEAEVAK
ncbi:aldehyde dehydrogenase family protein [uncultured Hydrogenophaga sp.]|uniref:aldehyde dehydrogenase family protein n=1 Tax=uncultured Hydrogenophaga sp. TaxID=199683 RepID=UPI00258DBACF|nr:aldehyde dehydrogenase family protein [uncultured Hydrogenophaga sp.]